MAVCGPPGSPIRTATPSNSFSEQVEAAGDRLFLNRPCSQRPHQGGYLDGARCLPFWDRVAALDVPVYFHPSNPMTIPAAFEGYPGLAGVIFGAGALSRNAAVSVRVRS